MPYHDAADAAKELAEYLAELAGSGCSMGATGRERVAELLATIHEDLDDDLGE